MDLVVNRTSNEHSLFTKSRGPVKIIQRLIGICGKQPKGGKKFLKTGSHILTARVGRTANREISFTFTHSTKISQISIGTILKCTRKLHRKTLRVTHDF